MGCTVDVAGVVGEDVGVVVRGAAVVGVKVGVTGNAVRVLASAAIVAWTAIASKPGVAFAISAGGVNVGSFSNRPLSFTKRSKANSPINRTKVARSRAERHRENTVTVVLTMVPEV